MKILKGQKIEIKGIRIGRWKEFTAAEDFDTANKTYPLLDQEFNKQFEPIAERCEIRIMNEEGKKKLIKYKSDAEVWDVVKAQIEKSNIKRYSWELILGESLTKTILRLKMKGLYHTEAYYVILEMPMVERILKFFPENAVRLKEKIWISVCARYGENNSALKVYNEEQKK
jgi:hypothetical protein